MATENYTRFSREAPWTDQGKELLKNARAYRKWLALFGPARAFELNDPPPSFPAIVIYARVRRTGFTECEFYWDFVMPSDFTPTRSPDWLHRMRVLLGFRNAKRFHAYAKEESPR